MACHRGVVSVIQNCGRAAMSCLAIFLNKGFKRASSGKLFVIFVAYTNRDRLQMSYRAPRRAFFGAYRDMFPLPKLYLRLPLVR
jgi:hypothetical protein